MAMANVGAKKHEVLHVLRRALSRHNIQHNDAPQDTVLHRQPDHPVHRHHLPNGARILPALRLRRKGIQILLFL